MILKTCNSLHPTAAGVSPCENPSSSSTSALLTVNPRVPVIPSASNLTVALVPVGINVSEYDAPLEPSSTLLTSGIGILFLQDMRGLLIHLSPSQSTHVIALDNCNSGSNSNIHDCCILNRIE